MSLSQDILVAGTAEKAKSRRAIRFAVDRRVSVDIKTTVNRVRDFASLAKPEITFMVMISAGFAFVVASSSLRVVTLLHTIVGTGLVAAGAGALNQYLERALDAQMRRTSRRPLPSGRVTGRAVLFFGAALSVIGTSYLILFVNGLTALLGILTSTTYLFVYTPLKTRTSLCTLIGAIPGAAPILMGWVAAQNNLTREAWALYLILFLWQFPHFYAIGWLYREDYARAWMKMLPALDEDEGKTTFSRILISTRLLILASLLFTVVAPASLFYSVLALSLGLSFYYVAYRASVSRSKLAAKTLLHASVVYLPLLYLVLLLDKFYLSTSIH
ncbi:MAG TPA: heme o synthase [Pyrinomonadaceae bacterium]|jgi:protoheme IX farnesyltransferase|nr:heme o synthase [Pyrinomonadaceae bacterium]